MDITPYVTPQRLSNFVNVARTLYDNTPEGTGEYISSMYERIKRRRTKKSKPNDPYQSDIRRGNREIHHHKKCEAFEWNGSATGSARTHSTDINTLYLNPGWIGAGGVYDESIPTGTNYTESFNDLNTMLTPYNWNSAVGTASSSIKPDVNRCVFTKLLQDIPVGVGSTEHGRHECIIDIQNLKISGRIINRSFNPISVRIMLLEKTDVWEFHEPNDQLMDTVRLHFFKHPIEPCSAIGIADNYWYDKCTPLNARKYAKINPMKWKVIHDEVCYIKAPMRGLKTPANVVITYDGGDVYQSTASGVSMGTVSDYNLSTEDPFQHVKHIAVNTGKFSVRYMKHLVNGETEGYFERPNLYFAMMAFDESGDPLISTALGYGAIDYRLVYDTKFLNLA